ncbi:MAG: hypothetical protein M3O30_05560 [Planctomycetota bacterium]|nr:hypothetical protein [Planctomycetota bacterium]
MRRSAITIYTDDTHVPGTTPDGTRTIYDGIGRVIETDRESSVTINVGSGASSLTGTPSALTYSATTYNADGSVVSAFTGTGALSGTHSQLTETDYYYNQSGQEVSMAQVNVPVWNGSSSSTQTVYTRYTYDADGRRKTIKDGLNHATTNFYDADGRVISTVFARGIFTREEKMCHVAHFQLPQFLSQKIPVLAC